MTAFIHDDIVWQLDPNKRFQKVNPERLAESLGLIPDFITEDTDDVIQTALDRYGFHLGGDMGGTILDDGTYKYPGDPELHPLSRCEAGGKVIFVYDYGIISFVDAETKEAVTYRFD